MTLAEPALDEYNNVDAQEGFSSAPQDRRRKLVAWSDPRQNLREFSYKINFGVNWITVTFESVEPPLWLEDLINSFIEINALVENWDSYGAPRISPSTAMQAFIIAVDDIGVIWDSAPPTAHPDPNGGVTLDWRDENRQLEVLVSEGGSLSAYFDNEADGEDWEMPIDSIVDLKKKLRLD